MIPWLIPKSVHVLKTLTKMYQELSLTLKSLQRKVTDRSPSLMSLLPTPRSILKLDMLKVSFYCRIHAYFCALGMNYLAGIFIIVMPTDYEAFICLTHVMQAMHWRCIYFTNTPKLTNMLDVLLKKIRDESFLVSQHLE